MQNYHLNKKSWDEQPLDQVSKGMISHSRWIIRHLLDSPARAPHQIIPPPRLLLMSSTAAGAVPYAAAQTSTDASSSTSDHPYSSFAPSEPLTIVVLVCAFFFFMGLFALFVRQCTEDTAGAGDSRHSAAARLRRSARGLDQELIDSFPIFHYADVKNLKIGESLECAVCINEFEEDEQLRLLPKCNHVFHPECIDMWLESHSTCPVCRANLVPTLDELGGTQSSYSADAPNFRSQLGELRIQNQNQVSIDVEEDDGSTDPEVSRQRVGKFPRSHSTGHSLGQLGNNCERYTLRLPEEVRKQIVSRKLNRTASLNVFIPGQVKQIDLSDRDGRSDRWVFTMTPPFLSRLVKSGKESVEGNLTALRDA